MFEDDRAKLRPLGRDGYVEKTVRARSTCLVQYDSNRYSVPSRFAGQHVSLRAYANRIVIVSGQDHGIEAVEMACELAKDFATFDYGAAAVTQTQIESFCTGQFTEEAHNLILVGGTGTGKYILPSRWEQP